MQNDSNAKLIKQSKSISWLTNMLKLNRKFKDCERTCYMWTAQAYLVNQLLHQPIQATSDWTFVDSIYCLYMQDQFTRIILILINRSMVRLFSHMASHTPTQSCPPPPPHSMRSSPWNKMPTRSILGATCTFT